MKQKEKEQYVRDLIGIGGMFLAYTDKGYDMIFTNKNKRNIVIRKDVLRDFCNSKLDIEWYCYEEVKKVVEGV